MTMEHWWNEDNHFHRTVQDGYHKKPACQSWVHTATKLLHSKPHTFTVVKKLQDADSIARIHFCNCFCDALYNGDISPSLTFFTDGALTHLKNMHVNTQNNILVSIKSQSNTQGGHYTSLQLGCCAPSQDTINSKTDIHWTKSCIIFLKM